MGDDAGDARVAERQRSTGRQLGAAIAIATSSIASAMYMWSLADLYTCPVGPGWPDESFAPLKLVVGTCLLAPGVVAQFVNRRVPHQRLLLWVTCLCALPAALAWLKWVALQAGSACPS